MLSSHEGRRWREMKWKQLARSIPHHKSSRKKAFKQSKAPGVRQSLFLPAHIEFLVKAFPNKGWEPSIVTAR